MKNKTVGAIIVAIATLIGFIIFSFNRALKKIVSETCTHGSTCPMWGTIDFQTNIGVGIMIVVIGIGGYLFFSKEEKESVKQIKPKTITKENYEDLLKRVSPDEKNVIEMIIEAKGTIFQSEIVDKTGFPKAKVTRILDKMEGMNVIERKRRGMTNVVILKH